MVPVVHRAGTTVTIFTAGRSAVRKLPLWSPNRHRKLALAVCASNLDYMAYRVERTEEEWRSLLERAEYHSLREGFTERPWSGRFVENDDAGAYLCKGCDVVLFRSESKFTAQCGWPAFSFPVEQSVVRTEPDRTQGMIRTRVRCSTCGSHLGFLFQDGPEERGGYRYCVNSIGLRLLTAAIDGAAPPGVSR